jgi:DNA processing protein
MLKGRDIIIYLAVNYKGEWNAIYQAIKQKEIVDDTLVGQTIQGIKSSVITIIDEQYPEALKKIYKPPFVLFYYGDIGLAHMLEKTIAVIGSRQPSAYGLEMTGKITQSLIEEGMMIVSGLAYGVDIKAHQTTLDHQGRTIGILGSGIDVCYPREHVNTYQQMKTNHLLLSEYPGSTPANKDHFPWRNRIIAGLSRGVFVAEAKKRSGTLITVGYALYLGKDVYVLPHQANTDNSTNQLIKDGAILVESGQDIMEHLFGSEAKEAMLKSGSEPEKKFI